MIYTALTGTIDTLRRPVTSDRYVAFFDGKAEGWECVPSAKLFRDDRRNARFHKILMPASDYDAILWVDANIIPRRPLKEYEEMMGDADMLVFKHTSRTCIYREAAAVMGWQMEDKDIVIGQMTRYMAEKYPEHNGLAETGFLLRKNNTAVKEFNRVWWEEVCRGSKRDQLSFNYAIWKTDIKVRYLMDTITDSPLLEYRRHENPTYSAQR